MLRKENRFHGRTAVARAYKDAQSYSNGPLRIWIKPADQTRVAVVVSKKVAKSAVVRNRIRRRIYELARHTIVNSENKQSVIVGVYDESIAGIEASKLEEMFDVLIGKSTSQ